MVLGSGPGGAAGQSDHCLHALARAAFRGRFSATHRLPPSPPLFVLAVWLAMTHAEPVTVLAVCSVS